MIAVLLPKSLDQLPFPAILPPRPLRGVLSSLHQLVPPPSRKKMAVLLPRTSLILLQKLLQCRHKLWLLLLRLLPNNNISKNKCNNKWLNYLDSLLHLLLPLLHHPRVFHQYRIHRQHASLLMLLLLLLVLLLHLLQRVHQEVVKHVMSNHHNNY